MIKEPEKEYSIEEHKHRFACWAASRAASASSVCRFRVEEGVKILEGCGFKENKFGFNPYTMEEVDELPEPKEFDRWHQEWCERAVNLDKDKKVKVAGELTYGVAAKLINCYLKARFVCGSAHEDEKVKEIVKAIHPPIDSILLKSLVKNSPKFKKFYEEELKSKAWSNFEEGDYTSVINKIKEINLDENGSEMPLWKIEYHWKGYRDK